MKATLDINVGITEDQFKIILKRLAIEVSASLDSLRGKDHDVTVNAQMVQKDGGFGYDYTIVANAVALVGKES